MFVLVVFLQVLLMGVCKRIEISPQCEEYHYNCTTISSVASSTINSSGYTELLLMPGHHYLNKNLTLAGVSFSYIMAVDSFYCRSSLTCQESIGLVISENASVHIKDLDFHNCNLLITQNDVNIITINNSTFHGNTSHHVILNKSSANISNTNFYIPLYIFKSGIVMETCTISNVNAITSDTSHDVSPCQPGVLTVYESVVQLSDFIVSNNFVNTSKAILSICNSILSSKMKLEMTNNNGELLYAQNSTLKLSGTTIIKHNCGTLAISQSDLEVSDNMSISNNLKLSECIRRPSKNSMVSSHDSSITFNGSVYISNNGVGALYFDQSSVSFYGHTHLSNNIELQGGAIFASNAIITFYSSVSIFNNSAVHYGGGLYVYQSKLTFNNYCTVAQNKAHKNGGGIFSYLSQINFYQNIEVKNNLADNGGGMYLSSSQIYFHSRSYQNKVNSRISSNQALNGGGIYLSTNSKIQLLKYDRDLKFLDSDSTLIAVHFISNKAVMKGGAIFVNDYSNFPTCTQTDELLGNCFIQVLETYSFSAPTSGGQTIFANVHFFNNSALKGSTYYGGLTDRCKEAVFSEISDLSKTYNIANKTNMDIDSEPLSMQLCVNNSTSESPTHFEIFRGQAVNVSVAAYDQNQQEVAASLFSRIDSSYGGLSEGDAIQRVSQKCTTVTYNIVTSQPSENLIMYADGPCRDSLQSKLSLNISFTPCPIGFELSESHTKCVCAQEISTFVCDIETKTISRQNNDSWVTYINITGASGILVYPHCPYDYCYPLTYPVHIHIDSEKGSDSQCDFNRSGTLCGSCQEGLSLVIGSSKCKKCGNLTLFLVIPIVLAGMLLVFLLMFLNLTVDIGTINGLILYTNTITILNTSSSTTYTNIVVEWINLNLGFETCFVSGMDEYSRAWLEFAFPFYLIALVVIIMVVSEKSSKLASLLGSSNPVATLATLILLSYTRLLRVSIHILSLGILTYPDGHSEYVWLADANIQYFKGKHIPLCLMGIVILIISLIYISFLIFRHLIPYKCTAATKWLDWLDSPRLKSFMDAYHAPFRPSYRSWCGLLLLFRTIVFLTSSLNYNGDQQINLMCVAILSFATIHLKNLCGRIYKNWVSNIETLYVLNLGIFSVAAMYARLINASQVSLIYVSQSVAIVMLILLICYHFEMKIGLFAKLSKIPGKGNDPPGNFVESAQSTSNEYATTSTYYSSVGKSNTPNSKTGSHVSSMQQDSNGIKSFSELREELLDS